MLGPPLVCLCGSTRFTDAFREANLQETLAGKIVLSVGCDVKSDVELRITPEQKEMLDELHLRKIDLADEVLILNVGGYIGESTGRELAYARAHGKQIRFLEPESPPSSELDLLRRLVEAIEALCQEGVFLNPARHEAACDEYAMVFAQASARVERLDREGPTA
jgi:hypothetical protein